MEVPDVAKQKARPPGPRLRKESSTLFLVLSCGPRGHSRNDIHAARGLVEAYRAINQGEQGPVTACPHITPRDKPRASLANEDAARRHQLATVSFYTKTFTDAIAPVPNASLTFLMCH